MDRSDIEKNTPPRKKRRSRGATIWRRFRRNRLAVVGLVIIASLVLLAVFADVIGDYQTKAIKMNIKERHVHPNLKHLFGTDEFGRDIFTRVVHGTRISLFVGIISVSIALLFGGTLGAIAGYYGGRVDTVIMRFLDVLLAIPGILLAITVAAALGASIINLMIAVGVANIPGFALSLIHI